MSQTPQQTTTPQQQKPNPTPQKDESITTLLQKAGGQDDSGIMKPRAIADPRKIPSIESVIKHMKSRRRIELQQLLPSQYWKKVEDLGPPNPNGNIKEQILNTLITFITIDFVLNEEVVSKQVEELLKRHQDVEGITCDLFCELLKRNSQ